MEYYTRKIQETENWKLAGIYADDGKSATNTKKRDDFKAMIKMQKAVNRHDTDEICQPFRQKHR